MPREFYDISYVPGGFMSDADERDMFFASVMRNERVSMMNYEYNACFNPADPYRSDETYGGDSFQYIPTEVQMAAAIAMKNMSTAGELPVQQNSPGMAQLLQSLYQRTADFWSEIRQASGTGW